MKAITIKKFGVMSLAKVMAALYMFMGFIFGAIMTIFSLFAAGSSEAAQMGVLFGIGAIIVFPIIYGVMGFVGGLLMGWMFNFVAPKVGGLTLHVEE